MDEDNLTYEDLLQIKRERKLTIEEEKRWKSVYLRRWRQNNPEKVERNRNEWRKSHPEKMKESSDKYYSNHKEQKKKYGAEYYNKNKDWINVRNKIFRDEHKELNSEYFKTYNIKLKIKTFNALGGCKCSICGDSDLSHLTIDHIDKKGHVDKKAGLYAQRLYRRIVNNELTKKQLSNLRVLCWNHNCSRSREYLKLPIEPLNTRKGNRRKLWGEAFNFFGPCSCGEMDLRFLTISHIHNDGAERRKNGERCGEDLLRTFRNSGWPETLKEDFCLECYNCNCSRLSIFK